MYICIWLYKCLFMIRIVNYIHQAIKYMDFYIISFLIKHIYLKKSYISLNAMNICLIRIT